MQTPSIVVYSTKSSPRLVYILDWLLKEVLHIDYVLTTNENDVTDLPCFISYGRQLKNSISIPASNLLWERAIIHQTPGLGNWEGLPAFFLKEDQYSIPFDIFSASFFLISRYEEYLPVPLDKHGRYPANESILAKSALLERPIVDEWIFKFYLLLCRNGFQPTLGQFSYFPTYDIDIAYSFKHKGVKRTLGAFTKEILKGDLVSFSGRLNVLLNKSSDPYDCFSWLKDVHQELHLTPFYFILCSLKTTLFDKNISPYHHQMSALIRSFAAEGITGLHPSYYSGTGDNLQKEKVILEHIIGSNITHSRQHYIRLTLPETYVHLLNNGITNDWSMGYGSKLGFRAGTGRSFFWYNMKKEQQTGLRVHPFCFMDSTAHFEEGLSAESAFSKLSAMRDILSLTSSQLVTVFHNFSLGSYIQWDGWNTAYYSFLKSITADVTI